MRLANAGGRCVGDRLVAVLRMAVVPRTTSLGCDLGDVFLVPTRTRAGGLGLDVFATNKRDRNEVVITAVGRRGRRQQ